MATTHVRNVDEDSCVKAMNVIKKITAILDRYHIPYRQGKPGDGYDLVILAPGGVQLWEVKNPEQPPSKRKLTGMEIATRDWCKIAGIPYEVLETAEEAAEICARIKGR